MAALLALVIASAAAPAAGAVCGPARARTVAENAHARVYVQAGEYVGCHGNGRRYAIGPVSEEGSGGSSASSATHTVRLAGGRVAYSSEHVSHAYTSFMVSVVGLRREREELRRRTSPASRGPYSFGFAAGGGPTTDLVLKRNGSVAWIVHRRDGPDVVPHQVRRCDRRGAVAWPSARTSRHARCAGRGAGSPGATAPARTARRCGSPFILARWTLPPSSSPAPTCSAWTTAARR